MGQITDARIRAFQERAGLEPATGELNAALESMKTEAAKLIEILVLEQSGIRDGDGFWHGSDVLGNAMNSLNEIYSRWRDTWKEPEQATNGHREREADQEWITRRSL